MRLLAICCVLALAAVGSAMDVDSNLKLMNVTAIGATYPTSPLSFSYEIAAEIRVFNNGTKTVALMANGTTTVVASVAAGSVSDFVAYAWDGLTTFSFVDTSDNTTLATADVAPVGGAVTPHLFALTKSGNLTVEAAVTNYDLVWDTPGLIAPFRDGFMPSQPSNPAGGAVSQQLTMPAVTTAPYAAVWNLTAITRTTSDLGGDATVSFVQDATFEFKQVPFYTSVALASDEFTEGGFVDVRGSVPSNTTDIYGCTFINVAKNASTMQSVNKMTSQGYQCEIPVEVDLSAVVGDHIQVKAMLWGTPLPLVGNTTLFTWGESQSGSNSSGPAHSNKWYLGIGVMIGFVVIVGVIGACWLGTRNKHKKDGAPGEYKPIRDRRPGA